MLDHVTVRRLSGAFCFSAVLTAALVMAGCSEKVEKTEDIRPVRAMLVAPASGQAVLELAGEVVPRYESRIGFRVGGKIVSRKVEVGSTVRRGQVLMQLDPSDLQLSHAQAKAAVAAAESTLVLARADLERHRELHDKNFISRAALDAKEAAFKAARSGHEQALAGLGVQANQSSYTTLVADADGVVTALEAEAGQVVSPGMPVVRIARSGDTEVRISIPEDQVDALREGTTVTVRTWANPDKPVDGRIREVAPAADPATRTFAARVTLPNAGNEVRLGMTATVAFSATTQPAIRLPLTALYNDKEQTSVWVVEQGRVRRVPVQLAGAAGNELLVASGLNPGQTVVTAGVNLLHEGQKVSILVQPPKPAPAGAAK